jgi:hypothetical protein
MTDAPVHGTEPDLDSGYTPEVACGGTLVDRDSSLVCAACDSTIAYLCPGCHDPVDFDTDGSVTGTSGEEFCYPCYESEITNASGIAAIGGEFHGQVARFTEHFLVLPDDDEDWVSPLFTDGTVTRTWVSTDAWRGYYDSTKSMTGVTSLVHGWVTGDYDDVPWKRDTHRFAAALAEHGHDAPVTLYVLTEPTSNVFSTAADVLVADTDKDAAVQWIATLGFTVDALDRAFG